MRIPNPYFKNVPCYGNLSMEQIIVEYVYPLLSVLKDDRGNRYLCICFDTRGAQQWIITPISTRNLIKLLKNKLTLSAPFESGDNPKVHAVRNYGDKKEYFNLLDANQIPEENLPVKGEFLDAEDDEWNEYIERITLAATYTSIEAAKKSISSLIIPVFTMSVSPCTNNEYNIRPNPNGKLKRLSVSKCYAR